MTAMENIQAAVFKNGGDKDTAAQQSAAGDRMQAQAIELRQAQPAGEHKDPNVIDARMRVELGIGIGTQAYLPYQQMPYQSMQMPYQSMPYGAAGRCEVNQPVIYPNGQVMNIPELMPCGTMLQPMLYSNFLRLHPGWERHHRWHR